MCAATRRWLKSSCTCSVSFACRCQFTHPWRRALVPDDEVAGYCRDIGQMEVATDVRPAEVRRIEHEYMSDHRVMDIAVNTNVADVIKRHDSAFAFAIQADVEGIVLRCRKGVVQDRIFVREAHLTADRDRQGARDELLAPRSHDIRRGGRAGFRRRLRPEIHDRILCFLGTQRLAFGGQIDMACDLSRMREGRCRDQQSAEDGSHPSPFSPPAPPRRPRLHITMYLQ